jgi:hypothetical protein
MMKYKRALEIQDPKKVSYNDTPSMRSITPVSLGQSKFVAPLPQMQRNSSIQKINNASLMGDICKTIDVAQNNDYIDMINTPVMKKAYDNHQRNGNSLTKS